MKRKVEFRNQDESSNPGDITGRDPEVFRRFFLLSPVGLLAVDKSATVVLSNSRAAEMLGSSDMSSLHAELRNAIRQALETGKKQELQIQAKREAGSATLDVCVVPDFSGGCLIFLQDITLENKSQEQFRNLQEKLRELSSHIELSMETERKRIAREIHDSIGSSLSAVKMELALLKHLISEGASEHEINNHFMSAASLVETSVGVVRSVASGLRPEVLDELGLAPTIKWYAGDFEKRTGIIAKCSFYPANFDPGPLVSAGLFRIFQEVLNNAAKHSGARRITVFMRERRESIEMKIHDDGTGIDLEKISDRRSFGIIGMRERARIMNGQLSIEGSKGTTVTVIVPKDKRKQ
jgi:signal transduction histidine kinase